MDQFSYNNIFETKGIEYLVIIAFLIMIIPFWIYINRKPGISKSIKEVFSFLSMKNISIRQGFLYSKNHTWAHLENSGNAKVGLDDFLLHITGEVIYTNLKKRGDFMSKGELMAMVSQKGKILRITSPLSGKIMNANTLLSDPPEFLNEDYYLKGWIYEVIPTDWKEETDSYFIAQQAVAWSKNEIGRFKDFMAETVKKYSPESSVLILQDGGELIDQPLSELPDEVWQDFQKSFLN